MGFFNILKKKEKGDEKPEFKLEKPATKISSGFASIFLGKKEIDEDILEKLEELLITADIGVAAASAIINNVRDEVSRGTLKDVDKLTTAIKDKIYNILIAQESFVERLTKPYVILIIGVNGVGKTTSIAKLANFYTKLGKKVMLAAGDTFRAAAADQLSVWAERLNIPIVKQPDGADPAAVVHDSIMAARVRNIDILIVDTAGRLHTKHNLMQELVKINRVITKQLATPPNECLLVLDATSGQNAVSQAKTFSEALGVTGIILTKLDGTAKGGVIVRIVHELNIPVRFIGFGESMDDLEPFDPKLFADKLF